MPAGPKRSALQQMLANLGSDDDVFSSSQTSAGYQGGAASSPQRGGNSSGLSAGLSGSDTEEIGRHDRRGDGPPSPPRHHPHPPTVLTSHSMCLILCYKVTGLFCIYNFLTNFALFSALGVVSSPMTRKGCFCPMLLNGLHLNPIYSFNSYPVLSVLIKLQY